MSSLGTAFITMLIEDVGRPCDTHDLLIEKIIRMLTGKEKTVIEISEKAGTGGFFTGSGTYVDVIVNKKRLRFEEINTTEGVAFDRYIQSPSDVDICEDYFTNFAFNLADQIIKDSVYILLKKQREEYIKQALADLEIYVDVRTFDQIVILVQKEFLTKYHRMWAM